MPPRPGNVASDGDGQNGLYTEHLVRELGQRGTRIEDALKRVRLNVRLASNGAQIPWETTSLESDVFIFNGGQGKLSETEIEKQLETDIVEWTRIKSSKNVDDWIGYLRNFPNGRFAEIAQMRLNRLLAEAEKLAAEQRQREEQKAREEQQRLEQQRIERERIRIAEEQRLAEERRKLAEQHLALEQKRLELEVEKRKKEAQKIQDEQKRLAELKSLEQERIENERIRLAEEQRLAAERKQFEAQQLQEKSRRQEEQQAVEIKRRQEQARLDRDRQRIAEDESLGEVRRQQETQRQLAEQKLQTAPAPEIPAAPDGSAPARPSSPVLPSGAGAIEIRAGLPMPMLIAPSANPFSAGRYPLNRIYTVGDFATIRVSDILTGIEERTRTPRVTRVDYDEDRVEYNNGQVVSDLMGNAIKIGPVQYDTPVQWTPAEFQIGRKWTAAFRLTRGDSSANAYYDMHIVDRETITVPAGSFDTFRIEGAGWNMTQSARLKLILWLVPGLNFAVKRELIVHGKKGRFKQTERQELVALHQQVMMSARATIGSDLARSHVTNSNLTS